MHTVQKILRMHCDRPTAHFAAPTMLQKINTKTLSKNLNFNRHISLEPNNMSTSLKYLIIARLCSNRRTTSGAHGVNARIVSVCANILIVSRRSHSAIFCARKYLPSVTQLTLSSGSSGLFPCSNYLQFFDDFAGKRHGYAGSHCLSHAANQNDRDMGRPT